MYRNFLSAILITATALNCLGWGQKGHDVVAAIAENHLTDVTRQQVTEILEGKSMIYWANWLDNASHTPDYDYTRTWHYLNVDEDQSLESAPLNPKGDVVRAIIAQREILRDSTSKIADKRLALRILIHLAGDIHQPMHLGHLSDLGGNKWKVKYFNSEKNLHGVWDSSLVDSAHKWSYSEWQDQIDRVTPEEEAALICSTNPEDWARESLAHAERIYKTTPQGSRLSFDYIAYWTPTIEGQLLKGGLRLAHTLNTIFDSEYESPIR